MKKNHQPWQISINDFYQFSSIASRIKFLLNFAILAPSTHNSQPWLFKIKDNKCYFYFDETRRLSQADHLTRDIHISIGCALENFIIAMRYFKVFDSLNYGPFAENNLLAKTVIKTALLQEIEPNYKPLVESILRRSNVRGFFQPALVPRQIIENIQSRISSEYLVDGISLHFLEDKNRIQRIASLTAEGVKIAYANPLFRQEMSRWINNNFSRRKEGIPGYALKMPALLSFIFPFIIRNFNVGATLAKLNFLSLNSAPLVVIITAPVNQASLWLKTGRLAERLMLEFNSCGFDSSIFVASIETGKLYERVQEIIGAKDLPQFLFAVGKTNSKHKLTPRYSIEEKIMN